MMGNIAPISNVEGRMIKAERRNLARIRSAGLAENA